MRSQAVIEYDSENTSSLDADIDESKGSERLSADSNGVRDEMRSELTGDNLDKSFWVMDRFNWIKLIRVIFD